MLTANTNTANRMVLKERFELSLLLEPSSYLHGNINLQQQSVGQTYIFILPLNCTAVVLRNVRARELQKRYNFEEIATLTLLKVP